MDRTEFMRQLEGLLQNISPEERAEALQYYNDYFDDAGPEKEQEVLEALGTPYRVAENIKRDLYGGAHPAGSPEQVGYTACLEPDRALTEYRESADRSAVEDREAKKDKKGLPAGVIVLLVVLGVLAAPALLGVATGLLGTLLGILAAWFICILVFGIAAVAVFAVAVVLVVVAVLCFPVSPLSGLALIGAALVCGGVGILFLMLTVAMAGIATPAIFRGIAKLCKKLFGRKNG